jgi:hypothetical protein
VKEEHEESDAEDAKEVGPSDESDCRHVVGVPDVVCVCVCVCVCLWMCGWVGDSVGYIKRGK